MEDVFADDNLPDAVLSDALSPRQDWVWRELAPSPSGGGYRGKARRAGCSVLCEPPTKVKSAEGSVFVLVEVDEECGGVRVSLSCENLPWSLNTWEVEGLRAMGHSRAARVREKRERALKRQRRVRACSADNSLDDGNEDGEVASKQSNEVISKVDTSPNPFFDSAMEEAHLKNEVGWLASPRMSDMSRSKQAGPPEGSNNIPRSLQGCNFFSCISFSSCWVPFRGCTLGCMHEK